MEITLGDVARATGSRMRPETLDPVVRADRIPPDGEIVRDPPRSEPHTVLATVEELTAG